MTINRNISNILIVAVLLAIMFGLNFLFYVDSREQFENEQTGDRSSYSGKKYGLLGYYTLLEESNYAVGRWLKPYDELKKNPNVKVLLIIAPKTSPTEEEKIFLKEWIFKGGVVFFVNRSIDIDIGNQHILTADSSFKGDDQKHVAIPWQPFPQFWNVEKIAISDHTSTLKWNRSTKSSEIFTNPFLPLIGINQAVVGGEIRYGSGYLICIADEFILANNGISEESNAILGLNLISTLSNLNLANSQKSKPSILFDEYHNGYSEKEMNYTSLSNYFRGTPVPFIGLQAIILTILMLYTFGKRFARPIPTKHISRASSLEYVSAMAQIHRTARSYDLVIENIYHSVHRKLCNYALVPPTASIDRLVTAVVQHSKCNPKKIKILLQRCQQILDGASVTEHETIQLVKDLRTLEVTLGL